VENTGNKSNDEENTDKSGRKPPGQFISDELEEQTARFIEGVKGLAKRRRELENEEGSGPPPPPSDGNQRSRRR
jgi:hypothetical protein